MPQFLIKVGFKIDIKRRLEIARALTNTYGERIDLTPHVRSRRFHLVPLGTELEPTFFTVVGAVARL